MQLFGLLTIGAPWVTAYEPLHYGRELRFPAPGSPRTAVADPLSGAGSPPDGSPSARFLRAHPGFSWVDKSGAKRPDRGDSLAAHGPGQAIGLPASLTRGTAEAPGSRAARRAVVPATRSALEAGGAAPQALHRKGIAAVGARPSTGKASSRTVIKGSSYTHGEPGRPFLRSIAARVNEGVPAGTNGTGR